eukprot:692743-Pelagomonas_calceolata.AAC.6
MAEQMDGDCEIDAEGEEETVKLAEQPAAEASGEDDDVADPSPKRQKTEEARAGNGVCFV